MIGELAVGTVAVAGALYAITARQLMRGVLGLALFFIAVAVLFAQLGAWYLAVGQLFLFVGGVITLFVLAFNSARTPQGTGKGVVAAFLCMVALAATSLFLPSAEASTAVSLQSLADSFFNRYGLVLNILLLLLFAALIGAQYLMEDA